MRAVVTLFLTLAGFTFPRSLPAQDTGCPPPDSLAGVGVIHGRVVDGPSGVPLGFAQIRVRVQGVETPFEARSATSGRFELCSLPAGTFTVSGQLADLGDFQGPFTLVAGQVLELELPLAPPASGRDTGTITGEILDADTGEPLEGALVQVPGAGQSVLSNPLGRFTFPSLPPGEVDLQVSRLGYADATGRVRIEQGKATETRVALSIEPVAMDPILVTATRRRVRLPDIEGFERRFYSGFGAFVLEEEIQRRSPSKVSQLLWETGVDVLGDGKAIRIRRTGCAPLVYLDDIKLTRQSRGGNWTTGGGALVGKVKRKINNYPIPDQGPTFEAGDAVNLVHPMDVVAIEVYRGPAETPGRYIDSNSRCGVILIWTRRGRIPGR